MRPKLVALGDAAIIVTLGEEIDPTTNRAVHALETGLRAKPLIGVTEAVPGYASLVVHYDPLQVRYADVTNWLKEQMDLAESREAKPPRRIEVPVRYGGEGGPDLEYVAKYHKLQPREVAEFHAGQDYLVYMMGFTPGFPYMGRLPEAIVTPRFETPRTRVRAGSVGIAGQQTGIYPVDSPGGWRLIGCTSLTLFDAAAEMPFLLAPGDRVRFVIEAVDA